MKRIFLFTGALFLVAGLSLYAAGGKEGAQGAGANVLNVGIQVEPDSMDPHGANNSTQERWIPQVYDPLIEIADDMVGYKPMLAETWEVAPNLDVYTFKLRKDVKFSDGTPFNAQAVKFNFDRITATKKLPYAVVKLVERVEIIDDYTVRMHLGQPFAPFMASLRRVFFVSPAAIRQHESGNDWAQGWLNQHSAGTGPYTLKEWVPRSNLVYQKNPTYWRGWAGKHFDTVNLRFIYEADAQRLLLEKGELDVASIISRDAIPALKQNPDVVVNINPIAAQMYVMINSAAGPTADVRVRKALAHAWDFKTYNQLMSGMTSGDNLPIPKSLMGPKFDLKNPHDFDLDKSRQLLADAGYPNGGFELEYLVQKGDEQKTIMFQVMQSNFAKIGISLKMMEMDWPALLARVTQWGSTRDPQRVPELLPFYKSPDVWHPWTFLWELFHSDAMIDKTGHWNMMYYQNPKVDASIDQAMKTVDQDKALDLWSQAAKMILDDSPALFIDGRMDITTMRASVGGWKFRPLADNLFFFYEMYRK